MGMMQEFKEFAVKGNVIDLAVGVIIGAAFGKIVDSIVADLIMPVVGAIFGSLDFSSKFIVMGNVPAGTLMNLDALKKAGVPVLAYGNFITIAVNFIILAFIIMPKNGLIKAPRKKNAQNRWPRAVTTAPVRAPNMPRTARTKTITMIRRP